MSKRGSRSARFIGGRSWRLSKARTSSSDPDKKDAALRNDQAKALREKRKRDRINRQFDKVCEKFRIPKEDIERYAKQKKVFVSIKKNATRLQIIQRIKSFKIYCKKYNEVFSLENYFEKEFYLIDFKKEFPDVYFFNVYPRNKNK